MFPRARKRLLTLDREPPPFSAPAGVIVQPAWEWMLELPRRPSGEE